MACSTAPQVTLNGILFDSSTLCFWAATGMSLLRLPFLIWKFDEQIFSDVKKSSESNDGPSDLAVWRWLALFIVTVILYNITYGVLMLCFQPILINQYKFGQFQISATMFTIVIVSLIPISFMAFLSKRGVQDRWFLIIGLGVACIPVAIFQWPSGSVWTVVLGGIFAVPFTTLIIPSCNTLFSKKAGTENASGFKVGLLLASVSIGLATGNALGAIALSMYGSYEFLMWLVPLFVDFVIILVVFRLLYVPPVTKAVSINDMEEDRWLLNDQHAKKP